MGGVDNFEWDDDKAARNLVKHGIGFDKAIEAFRDPSFIERVDNRFDYGEARYNMLAMWGGIVFHITYTERGNMIRLISVRKAEKIEQEYYYRQNKI